MDKHEMVGHLSLSSITTRSRDQKHFTRSSVKNCQSDPSNLFQKLEMDGLYFGTADCDFGEFLGHNYTIRYN